MTHMEGLAIAVCCREWIVDPLSRIGRCGFCHEHPVVDWSIDIPIPELPDPWPVQYDEGWIAPMSDRSVHYRPGRLSQSKAEETERS